MTTSGSTTLNYRLDLDGLRALAVVPVIFFHAGVPPFHGGFVGVSVFFVISGYLMATLIGRGLERGDFSLAYFYERRVRRIFPALLTVLFFCAVVAAVIVPPKLFRDFGVTLVATVLFASNFAFWWKSANYFDAPAEWNPLLHTWSLAVEEQFYVLFPLYLILVWRFGWRVRFGFTALVAFVSLVLSVWGTANAPTATFYLLPTRAWELLVGSLVAIWAMRAGATDFAREESHAIDGAAGMLGLLLILGSLLFYDREMTFPGISALVPTIGAALLIHFGRNNKWNPATRLLSLAPFTFVGRISYSLYLWHWPLIVFADKYRPFGELGTFHKIGVFAFSLVAAFVSWRWIEQPFRTRKFPISRTVVYGAAAASIASLGVIGALAQITNGWPERVPGIAAVSIAPQLAAERRDTRWQEFNARNCLADRVADWGKERCFLGQDAELNALLWGDSFAASYASGFFDNPRSGFNVLQYTSPQCPPVIGYAAASRPQCAEFNREVIGIIKRYNISTVFMAANWSAYFKRRKMQVDDIGDTAAILRGLGVRVVVFGQSPVFTFPYSDEYFFRVYGSQQAEGEYFALVDVDPEMNRSIRSIVVGNTFFDPLAIFCREAECAFKRSNLYLFVDYGHYTQFGSKLAVGALLNAIKGVQVNVLKEADRQ